LTTADAAGSVPRVPQSLITIREIFHSDVRDDGFVDLNEFTTCMRRSGGGAPPHALLCNFIRKVSPWKD